MRDSLILNPFDGMLLLGLVGLLLLLWARMRRRTADRAGGRLPPSLSSVPSGVTLSPHPLLSETEATFYNLLRLAVQDRFLVFAQVPVWRLAEIQAQDRRTRAAFLNQVALKRVDFALVHPGNRTVAKVVELQDAVPPSPQREARARLLDAVCRGAGIEVIRLDGRAAYTVPALAARLGLEPEE